MGQMIAAKLKNIFLSLAIFSFFTLSCLATHASARPAGQTYLFIGDSRFVGMQDIVGSNGNVYWIDRVGAGSELYFEYQEALQNCDRNVVVIYNLGVNDLNADLAVQALTDLSNLGFRHVWFSTVGPVNEEVASSYGYTITNDQIVQFNEQVVANLPSAIGVVDSFYHLWYNGFTATDGLHYDGDTYAEWYGFLLTQTF